MQQMAKTQLSRDMQNECVYFGTDLHCKIRVSTHYNKKEIPAGRILNFFPKAITLNMVNNAPHKQVDG